MPDEATTRDVAKKLERWAASLPDSDRRAVTGWMLLGTDEDELEPGRRWWYEASIDSDRPPKDAAP